MQLRNTFLLLLLCVSFNMYAQNNTVSSGGQATGSGGSVSYTIGQVAYTTFTGNNGSLIQGVQQPYEISIVTNTRDLNIDLKAQVYPNPTADQLILSINNQELKNLRYVLLDVQGKTLASDRINQTATSINLSSLSNGTYLLRVLSNKKQIKTFQLIKNK